MMSFTPWGSEGDRRHSFGIDSRVKLCFLLCFGLSVVLFDSPLYLMVGFLVPLLLSCLAGIPWARYRKLLCVYYPLTVLLLAVLQAVFFSSPERKGLFSMDGFWYGLIQALRVIAVLQAGFLVLATTSPIRLFAGLRQLGFPYEVCFLMSLALRMVPLVLSEVRLALMAIRARSARELRAINWLARPGLMLAVGETVFINAIHSARDIALAVDLRAFRALPERTFSSPERMNPVSWLTLGLILAGTIWVLVAYFLGWGCYII